LTVLEADEFDGVLDLSMRLGDRPTESGGSDQQEEASLGAIPVSVGQ